MLTGMQETSKSVHWKFYDQTKISRPTYMRGVGFMAEQRGTGGEGGVFPLPLAVRGVKLLHFYEGEYIHPIERGDFFYLQ